MEENQKPEVKSQVVRFSTADINAPEKAKKRTPIVILIILAVVLFVPIAVIAYLMATGQLDFFDKVVDGEQEVTSKESVTENEEEEVSTDPSEWKTWTGEYLSAKLPEGWRIVERDNENGVYGFVGFSIMKDALGEVVRVEHMPVAWSPGACTGYYVFADSNPTECDSHVSSDPALEKIEVSDYSEINFMDTSIRRYGTIYIEDYKTDDDYFDYGCKSYVDFNFLDTQTGKSLSYAFDSTGDNVYNDYLVMIGESSRDFTQEELSIADTILESIHVVNGYDLDSNEKVVDSSTWETWTGEYLSAKLPEGWSADEETNTSESFGFAKFVIKDRNGNEVFEISSLPAFGIGGPCSCTVYTVFEDSDLTPYNELQESYESEELLPFECHLEKKLITEYSEFTLLGLKVRRVDRVYYVDENKEDSFFDGQCDVLGFSVFHMTDPVTGESLDYKQGDVVNQEDLVPDDQYELILKSSADAEIVDKILPTLQIVKGYDWDAEL